MKMEMLVTKFSKGKYRNESDLFAEPISKDNVKLMGEMIALQLFRTRKKHYAGYAAANCDADQTAATTERPIGNCSHACRNDYACDRYAVERPSPIVVKPSGKLMLARLVQQKNAWAFMVVMLFGRTAPVIVVFSWKACAPISLTGMPL